MALREAYWAPCRLLPIFAGLHSIRLPGWYHNHFKTRYHSLLPGRAASVAGTAGSMHAVLHRAGAGRQQPGAELRDFLNVAPDQLQMNENKRVLSPLLD